ncbi:MAG: CPBP family intramembrane glutamic endopeptidase [Armatimonadota bacterium]|nr:CPBP family intramembrane glutamic endopeptidase [Armatimonadota bacterium]MDR7422720.1 CPBP family intramembrane glutamic endopeptidase [Armatimonadota bacterium]MDR7457424.1 CPBP family intramembrane glutamic endopeptidase [Armatimonadota bacterium]MDR7497612.1 CPBP family intramembrane glutamic endopeptidase [Armatimonadota bacterium]MDR7512119.1 CPBP family intramembrane glutamic endopeptidase [Armatimonadota bacterium]
MVPAAVYPVPDSQTTALLMMLAFSGALAAYLLAIRPVSGGGLWGLGEMFAVTLLFVLTLPAAAHLAGIGLPFTLADLTVVALAQNAMFVAVPAYVALARYRLPAATLGLRAEGWPRLGAVGLLGAAAAMLVAVGMERLVVYLLGLVIGPARAEAAAAAEHADDPLLPILNTLGAGPELAWFFVLLAVVVPVGEEVFFRGFVYGGLRARWGPRLAAVASGLFFAAVHLQLVHGVPIFALGLLLAWLYARTGSLLPPVIAHAAHNVIAVLSAWYGWGL